MNLRALTSVLILLTMLLATALAGTLYKKTNADGSVEYSDKPFAGATAVETQQSNQASLPALPRPDNQTESRQDPLPDSTLSQDYAISIQSPVSQQSIRSNNGDLTIMVQTTPKLTPALKVQLLINNSPYGQPSQDTVFKLKNLDRGQVKIKAQLIDNNGNVLATSSEAIVYLLRVAVKRAN